jgi:hypothetical protein
MEPAKRRGKRNAAAASLRRIIAATLKMRARVDA